MRRTLALSIALSALTLAASTQAQSFENLDFESAVVVSNDPDFGFLSWDLAVPSWAHGDGADSGTVYHGAHHVGLTPWYLLVDGASPGPGPLQGNHSLAFANGRADAQSENSAWIESFVAQQGRVPDSVRSLRFLATGQVELRVNGLSLALLALGPNAYAADISAFAGQTVELRLSNRSTALHDPVVIDDIRLSSASAVPEPATVSLSLVGLALLGLALSRRGR